MSLIIGLELPPPSVWISRLQASEIKPPPASAPSSYTYSDHVPLASNPLKLVNAAVGATTAPPGSPGNVTLPRAVGLKGSGQSWKSVGRGYPEASVRQTVT